MTDDSLLELVNSAIATLIEVKQRLEEGEGIADKPESPDGWKPVDFFNDMPGPVTEQEMQQAQLQQEIPAPTLQEAPPAVEAGPQQISRVTEPTPQMQPRFCRNCGKELDPNSKFCRECGQAVG